MTSNEIQLTDTWPLVHSWPLPSLFGAVGTAAGNLPSMAPANLDQMRGLADIGFWECDLRDNALNWTPGVFDLFGLPSDVPLLRADSVACYYEESREAMEVLRAYAIRHCRGFTLDARLMRPDGGQRWMRLTTSVACTNGRARRLYGTKQDVTLEYERRNALQGATDIDDLTGLATRAAFERYFAEMLLDDRLASAALLLMDVAQVEPIRGRFGAAAGDACLGAIGAALTRNGGEVLMAGRLEDCRFGILVQASPGRGGQGRSVARLIQAVSQPIFWQGYLLRVVPSCGMVLMSEAIASDPDALLAVAAERLNADRHCRDGSKCEGPAGSLMAR
ncbi:GGDEF domain-containing protein [Sphingobium aquiterrae]|uniref:GGDEF domain-containing protein n=1 Tax=Sphingobium aquiterrae TaxID=2038656 RepID=UPI00301B5C0C